MWRRTAPAAFTAAFLFLASLTHAIPDGDHHAMNHDMNMDSSSSMHMGHGHGETAQATATAAVHPAEAWPMSYFSHGEHSGTIIAHIALMILAWCFVLPTGVMLSVARSRLALPSQFIFLVLNAAAVLVGMIYNGKTPDLYENNAHHKLGWVVTWVATAQVAMTLIFTYAGRGKSEDDISPHERGTFLPVSTDDNVSPLQPYPSGAFHDYRWSGDSGQRTERASSSLHSRPTSPNCDSPNDYDGFEKPEDQVPSKPEGSSGRWLQGTMIDRFLSSRMPKMVSSRVLRGMNGVHMVIERIILPFGFAAIATGGVTYGGIMRGIEVFNGLAHFIKGGIFFWYGLLTLGRCMGCWADLGWAWNVKPTSPIVSKWKANVPSAEFTESSVIFVYGITNVFLEHLAGSGKGWSATDMEHVSISIMFLGGGLCGMLFESKRIKKALNDTILRGPMHRTSDTNWEVPDTQKVSLNPMPALVILLLGMMMGSHHQDSMVSTMVHKQWGNLLVGFALARGATYLLLYVKPPASYYPSRPPTEIIASFCLVGGGLIFMLSTRNIVQAMEYFELDAMFAFTVGMGFSAFIMACAILSIALKAWAVKREPTSQLPPFRFPAPA